MEVYENMQVKVRDMSWIMIQYNARMVWII